MQLPNLFLPSIFLLPLLFIVAGCSKPSANDTVRVNPEVLDFGEVRVYDSPVHLSFDIENRGSIPLVIEEISSGCGCTVVDVPSEPILAQKSATASVKVNLFGRSGDFVNKIRIATSRESLFVDIRGKIISDFWYNRSGDSVLYRIERNESQFFLRTSHEPIPRHRFRLERTRRGNHRK